MGGSKNKSPAQKEKSQGKDVKDKKSKKSGKSDVSTSVTINESKATKYINESKIINAQGLARQIDVKISIANSFLQKLLAEGTIKRTGGFSGHHLYKSVSGN